MILVDTMGGYMLVLLFAALFLCAISSAMELKRGNVRSEEAENSGSDDLQEKSREKRHNHHILVLGNTNGCSPMLFQKLETSCCQLPIIMQVEAVQNCSVSRTPISAGDANRNNMRRRQQQTFGKQNQTHVPHGACFYDCVFRNQSWISVKENTLDTAAIEATFATANETWQSLLEEALSNCTDLLQAGNVSTVGMQVEKSISSSSWLVSGKNGTTSMKTDTVMKTLIQQHNQKCSMDPMILVNCLKKSLLLNCPDPTPNSEMCESHLTKLQNCEPNDLRMINE